MKQKKIRTKKSLMLDGLFIVVFIGLAVFLYNNLSKQIEPEIKEQTGEKPMTVNFQMTDSNGETVNFDDFKGKPIVLNFWASWCPPCKIEMPYFEAMNEKYGEDVQFIMLNATDGQRETEETAKKYIEESGYKFPVFYDFVTDEDNQKEFQLAAYTYGIRAMPTTFFIDTEGYVQAAYQGAISEKILETEIQKIVTPK